MGKAADAETLGVHVSKEIVRVITARAVAIGLKKSKFAALLFEEWRAAGYPSLSDAISKVDQTVRDQVMQQIKDEDSRARNPQQASPSRALRQLEVERAKAEGRPIQVPSPEWKRAERQRLKVMGKKVG